MRLALYGKPARTGRALPALRCAYAHSGEPEIADVAGAM